MNKTTSWDFYAVKLIRQIVVEGEPDLALVDRVYYESDNEQIFEESIMLVRAQSIEHAYRLAESKAMKFDEPYQNQYGEQVSWKFIKAVDCYMILDELKSGAEIYSCLHHADKDETADEFIKKWFDSL